MLTEYTCLDCGAEMDIEHARDLQVEIVKMRMQVVHSILVSAQGGRCRWQFYRIEVMRVIDDDGSQLYPSRLR